MDREIMSRRQMCAIFLNRFIIKSIRKEVYLFQTTFTKIIITKNYRIRQKILAH